VLYHWCPICLSIAASLLILALSFATETLINLTAIIKKGDAMKTKSMIRKILVAVAVFVVGAVSAFAGITKHDSIAIAQSSFDEKIAFGKQDSPITVYVFTSWSCPACKMIEPKLAGIVTPLESKAKIIFIDHVSDVKTLNYAPYNLSFMLNNRKQYFELRKVLREVGAKTDAPSEEQVEHAVAKIHEKYKQLNYADVEIGIGYFKEMSNEYEITSLPSVVIVNTKNKEHKMLSGTEKVTSEHIISEIDAMQKDVASAEADSKKK